MINRFAQARLLHHLGLMACMVIACIATAHTLHAQQALPPGIHSRIDSFMSGGWRPAHARRLRPTLPDRPLPASRTSQACSRSNYIVYGFHPDWISDQAISSYQFDLLSHVAWFGYQLNVKTGGVINPGNWTTTHLVDSAHAAGCKVHLTVNTISTNGTTHDLLSNPDVSAACIDSICNWVRLRKADGVCVDFEDIDHSENAALFLNWITSLRAALKKDNAKAELVVTTPAIPGSTTFTQLDLYKQVDFAVIMGYDFSGSWDTQPASTAPLPPDATPTSWTLQGSIDRYLTAGVSPSQLVMGLPYYGPSWNTSASSGPGTFYNALTFSQVVTNYSGRGYSRNWDQPSQSSWYVKSEGEGYQQAWVLDSTSMAQRYDTVKARHLAGAGIWALSYDAGSNALWDLLNIKFGSCTALPPISVHLPPKPSMSEWASHRQWILPWACLATLVLLLIIVLVNRKAREEILNRYWLFPLGTFILLVIFIVGHDLLRRELCDCNEPDFPWLVTIGAVIVVIGFLAGRLWAKKRSQR